MSNKEAFVVPPGEGRSLNALGHAVTVKLRSAETDGEYYIFELVSPPGGAVPPHVHRREDEVIYVIEGEFEVWLAGQTIKAGPGSTIHFARGVAHGFQNVGATPGKTLFTVIPGSNFEQFFEELCALPPGPPDLPTVAAIFSKYDLPLLPPPEAA